MRDPNQNDTEREPWLRETLTELPAVVRAVVHALQLAQEDVDRWCGGLTGLEMNHAPAELPTIAFQLRHITGSADRLLSYAEGRELDQAQLNHLAREAEGSAVPHVALREFHQAMRLAAERVRRLAGIDLEARRVVGRARIPTTLGGLLIHLAEHTQRHAGQVIITSKIVLAQRVSATLRSL